MKQATRTLLALLLLLHLSAPARADGHRKKVIGATLIAVGSVLDAATTALTFTGLGRAGWSFAPRDPTDTALLWSGVAGNFALDTVLTMGIVIYCQGGDEMRKAKAAAR
jgi:hypothetical protein